MTPQIAVTATRATSGRTRAGYSGTDAAALPPKARRGQTPCGVCPRARPLSLSSSLVVVLLADLVLGVLPRIAGLVLRLAPLALGAAFGLAALVVGELPFDFLQLAFDLILVHCYASSLLAGHPVLPSPRYPQTVSTLDTLGRPLRDLRISVTDRCNFRCVYCMPKEVFGRGYRFLDRKELLTFEEIERLARVFVGARRREGAAHGRRAAAPARPGAAGRAPGGDRPGLDLTLTTNGSLLAAEGARPRRRRACDA